MSRISRAEVERIARLARLRLSDAEASELTGQLERILDHVAQLDGLDTEGVPPTAHVLQVATPLRADTPHDRLSPEDAVANAPDAEGTAFAVPRVLDSELEG